MADSANSLEQRIDAVESRLAIAELVHRYARFVRYDQAEQASTLFTEDGTFEVRDGHPDKPEFTVRSRQEGRAAIAASLGRGKGGPHPVPLIHNLIVELDGDSATGNCVMEGQIFGTGQGVFGEYRDALRRADGQWLFAARVFTIFGGAGSV